MRLRPPSTPLITVDPYFTVWSPADRLTDAVTCHWTGKPNTIVGTACIDGETYRFMGKLHRNDDTPVLTQTAFDYDALSTRYTFTGAGVTLKLTFTTPLLMDDLAVMTRPVSYLEIETASADGCCHDVTVKIAVSEEICLNLRSQSPVVTEVLDVNGRPTVKMGNSEQQVLNRSGDDIRIDWGYFYLTTSLGTAAAEVINIPYCPHKINRTEWSAAPEDYKEETTFASVTLPMHTCHDSCALVTFAYDDIKSIEYFGDHLTSFWNKDGMTITEAIDAAYNEYVPLMQRCTAFAEKMFHDAVRAGGEKYAEICEISYRQAIAAHKVAVDTEGQVLFISKECFSNGCAATVDVSYPSIPLFLLYNPELVRGMMRPIYKFARSDMWKFDFAPHDAGQFPLVNCQRYGMREGELKLEFQMPVEECGNMLVMAAAVALADKETGFAEENMDLLEAWVKYLIANGYDPENQLCTDDFAGHLAHNCNLSLKAIMGITGLALIYRMLGRNEDADKLMEEAKKMADSFIARASNGDGSFRLAYDRPGTWSMKYNAVWDKLWGTGIFDPMVMQSEFASYRKHINPYGMPLDNRSDYTKSDWLIWTGTLAREKDDFIDYVTPLWKNYHHTESRVPATDWYFTTTSIQRGFQHRTVVGGHFMKLLEYYGKMAVK